MLVRPRIKVRGASCVALVVALAALPAADAAAKSPRAKTFRSCGDWVRYARAHAPDVLRPYTIPATGGPSLPPAAGGGESGGGGGDGGADALQEAPVAGEDFSTTNVQEQGVDEPDVVKTDGRVVYVASSNGYLRSFDVSGGVPRPLDVLQMDGYSPELLLQGDKLLVISGPGEEAAPGVGRCSGKSTSNPSALRTTRIMQVEGWYVGGRLTGSTARVVIATEPDVDIPPGTVPETPEQAQDRVNRAIRRSKIGAWRPRYKLVNRKTWEALVAVAGAVDAVRRPAEFSGLGTLTVLTIDLSRGLPPVDSDALFADADTVYASTDSLYLATHRWTDSDNPSVRDFTTIHKFAAPAAPETGYRATGSVDGYLLSQWALSEKDGVLRPPPPASRLAGRRGLGQPQHGVHAEGERGGSRKSSTSAAWARARRSTPSASSATRATSSRSARRTRSTRST